MLWLTSSTVRPAPETSPILPRHLRWNADYLSGDAVAGRPGFADLSDPKLREGVAKKTSKQVLFDWVRLVDAEGKPSDVFFEGEPLTIELGLESTIDSSRLEALCFVSSLEGILVFTLTSGLLDVDLRPGPAELKVTIPRNQLRIGRYTLDLYVLTAQPQDYLVGAKTFEVVVWSEARVTRATWRPQGWSA